MDERLNVLPPRWPAGAVITIMVVILAFVTWDNVTRSRHLLEISEGYGVAVDAPTIDGRSPTGYAGGRRSLLLSGSASDAQHWIMHTQAMFATGEWRLRHVEYDNAPEGREVHWAGPFRWWLAALAWADHVISGRPIGIAVERAALVAPPVMFALVVIGLLIFLRGSGAGWLAVLVIGSMVAVQPFYLDFVAGRADHHGLANLCGLFSVWLLVIGSGAALWRRAAGRAPQATPRHWFVASAIVGGVGLWISASTLVPVLIGTGLGVLVAGGLGRGGEPRIAWLREPDLFRLWGRVGGGVSFAAWLIEYFPGHLGMRLEVNHPFYALAWLGAGEGLCLYARVLRDGWRAPGGREWARGAVGTAAVALAPLTILMWGERVFLLSNPMQWRIGAGHVSETQSLWQVLAPRESLVTWLALTLPMAWLLLPVLVAWHARLSREWSALLALAWMPAALGWSLGCGQIRWLGLAWAMTVPLMVVFMLALRSRFGDRPRIIAAWSVVAGLLFIPGAVYAVRQSLAGGETTSEEIRQLAERDLAHWLRLRAGDEPAVVAAAPGATTWLIAYGGLRGIGTLYWENTVGLERIAELYAAPTAEAARALVRHWGITHFVYVSWGAFETELVRDARGLRDDEPVPADAFIMRLLSAPVPEPWLRAVPFTLPVHAALAGAQVRIWEVVAEQTPAEAAAHAANFFLELGRADDAKRLAPVLSRFDDELCATVMLAAIASSQRDTAAFLAAVEHVSAELAQADALALDDHVHLVVVLAVAQRMELARANLQSCLRKANARSVRQLTPGTLADLLALTEALGVAWPDRELEELAKQLLPPARRR